MSLQRKFSLNFFLNSCQIKIWSNNKMFRILFFSKNNNIFVKKVQIVRKICRFLGFLWIHFIQIEINTSSGVKQTEIYYWKLFIWQPWNLQSQSFFVWIKTVTYFFNCRKKVGSTYLDWIWKITLILIF